MTRDADRPLAPVTELPGVGESVPLEGTEWWLSTLEDPHDATVPEPAEYDEL